LSETNIQMSEELAIEYPGVTLKSAIVCDARSIPLPDKSADAILLMGPLYSIIMVCVGIYSVLVQSIATSGDISRVIWSCMGYTVLLCFALFKTGSLSKSLFGAH